MHANVKITARRGHEIVDYREGHNIWVTGGSAYLAKAAAFSSPLLSTTEGSVHLVALYPTLINENLYLRLGHETGVIGYQVVLSSPVDAAALIAQINAQAPGITASLGPNFGLVLTSNNPTTVEIVAGTALPKLGLTPEYVAPSGMTTTPLETRRIKYMGFGIGGVKQSSSTVFAAPLNTSYPPGSDPAATTGSEYNSEYPLAPLITSLERPVRISGGSTPYPGDPGDVWLVQAPQFSSYVLGTDTLLFVGKVDAAGGEILYGPFSGMPLSEVGLFLSDASLASPYNAGKLVAYHSFGTISLTPGIQLELIWTVSF